MSLLQVPDTVQINEQKIISNENQLIKNNLNKMTRTISISNVS